MICSDPGKWWVTERNSVAVLNANCFETFRNDSLQRTNLFKVKVVTSFSKSIGNKRVVKLSFYGLCYAYFRRVVTQQHRNSTKNR